MVKRQLNPFQVRKSKSEVSLRTLKRMPCFLEPLLTKTCTESLPASVQVMQDINSSIAQNQLKTEDTGP